MFLCSARYVECITIKMRKAIIIISFILIAFLTEFILFNSVGWWGVPNLLLLLIMFFDLYFGVRYGLLAAIFAGVIKDSFGVHLFGIHLSSFVVCVYMTTMLKRYIYHIGSFLSRYILILTISVLNVVVHYFLYQIFGNNIRPWHVFRFILIPEVVMTMVAAPVTFKYLKKCVSRLFV